MKHYLVPKARKGKQSRRRSVAGRVCEAVKELMAERLSRGHAAQWIMVHDVARHLGLSDDRIQEAIIAAGDRLVCIGTPAHSISLIYGWGEEG